MTSALRRFSTTLDYRVKIFVTFLLALTFFLGLSTWLLHIIQARTLKDHVRDKGNLMAKILAANLATATYFDDKTQIAGQLKVLSHFPETVMAVVYDVNGAVLVEQAGEGAGKIGRDRNQLVKRLRTNLAAYRKQPEQEFPHPEHCFVFTASVHLAGTDTLSPEAVYFDPHSPAAHSDRKELVGYVQLALNRSDFDRQNRLLLGQTLLLAVFLLIIAFLASWHLSREAVAPLRALLGKIRGRMGRFCGSNDEISALDATFDHLVVNLEQAFATVDQLKNGLEDQVAIRTHELQETMQELRDTHAHLVHAEKMVAIGRLVAGVAHEINNTTNFVSGALGPLTKRVAELKRLLAEPEMAENREARCAALMESIGILVENIREGARRTNAIVEGLKDFSRPSDESLSQVDINRSLETTIALAYPEYKLRIDLIPELEENLPTVEGASGQLNQVFMNILLNAIHAQPVKGFVRVRTWSKGGYVHILFQDGGPGIPAFLLEKIFDPFFTTREVGKGTGLGLSISYGIVKKHQGDILVRSAPGKGSEFEVVLPVKRSPESGADS